MEIAQVKLLDSLQAPMTADDIRALRQSLLQLVKDSTDELLLAQACMVLQGRADEVAWQQDDCSHHSDALGYVTLRAMKPLLPNRYRVRGSDFRVS